MGASNESGVVDEAIFGHLNGYFFPILALFDAPHRWEPVRISQQEAQLPQRNSASATHDYLGWSADLLMITLGDAMHRTQQNRGGCIIF